MVEANEIYFPAREMTVHTLRYSRKSFCLDLRQLHDSPKANEWALLQERYPFAPAEITSDCFFHQSYGCFLQSCRLREEVLTNFTLLEMESCLKQ